MRDVAARVHSSRIITLTRTDRPVISVMSSCQRVECTSRWTLTSLTHSHLHLRIYQQATIVDALDDTREMLQ